MRHLRSDPGPDSGRACFRENHPMSKKNSLAIMVRSSLLLGLCAHGVVQAGLSAVVAVEPTARKASYSIHYSALDAALSRAAAQPVSASASEDMADVMRATRSAGFDIFIGPAQVAASALHRGYELVGATQASEPFLLVVRKEVSDIPGLKTRRIYLPQQDSIYTYMARGLLNQGGLSMQDMKVAHERFPQAGLTALMLGAADATVVTASEWNEWSAQNPQIGRVLAKTEGVPAGLSVVLKKDLPADVRGRLSSFFNAPPAAVGLPATKFKPEGSEYKRVSELGLFTPTSLPGVTRVSAREAQKLQGQGALLVDTRTEKEFQARHIPGAVWAPYIEKSLKDIAFNAAQDDFSALAKVDKLDVNRAVIFACNGAECWKSYKAARVAQQKGFKKVHWLRGGLPEWEAEGLPVQNAAP